MTEIIKIQIKQEGLKTYKSRFVSILKFLFKDGSEENYSIILNIGDLKLYITKYNHKKAINTIKKLANRKDYYQIMKKMIDCTNTMKKILDNNSERKEKQYIKYIDALFN